jgi:histidinol-phosphatase (PHP family)
MEINTRRLGAKEALDSLVPIYQRYRELGGRFVTLGSDAHTPEAVGAHFRLSYDFAESLKLTPVSFSQQQMVNSLK